MERDSLLLWNSGWALLNLIFSVLTILITIYHTKTNATGKKLIKVSVYSIHIHLNCESLEATLWQIALVENYVKKGCASEPISKNKKPWLAHFCSVNTPMTAGFKV